MVCCVPREVTVAEANKGTSAPVGRTDGVPLPSSGETPRAASSTGGFEVAARERRRCPRVVTDEPIREET